MIPMIKSAGGFLESRIPKYAREWRNDPSIRQWCRQYTDISPAQHEKWLSKIEADPSIKMFTVHMGSVDVGVCGLTSIDHINQSAEFSLYIAKEYQRKEYGSHALITLLDHGFRSFNLNRIWGETFDGNPALKLFEKIGFKREGTSREAYYRDGAFIDSHIVSLLRNEFKWST